MPSYRVIMTIGALQPGVRPDAVLPAAAAAAAERTTVEASDLATVRDGDEFIDLVAAAIGKRMR